MWWWCFYCNLEVDDILTIRSRLYRATSLTNASLSLATPVRRHIFRSVPDVQSLDTSVEAATKVLQEKPEVAPARGSRGVREAEVPRVICVFVKLYVDCKAVKEEQLPASC